MTVFKTFKDFLGITQTKVGIVFSIFVPLVFLLFWMTGYHGATERVDQLVVGIVNEDGTAGDNIAQAIATGVPYKTQSYPSLNEAQQHMDNGELTMVISIPAHFTEDVARNGSTQMNYYINQGNSDIAKSIVQSSAAQISSTIGEHAFADVHQEIVTTNVVKTHDISNFAISMLPMILGFVTYVGVMTMNIQLNIASMMLKRDHSKWQIFWGRQILLLAISIVASLLITTVATLFADTAASFWQMWSFHLLVYISCIAVTQMAFALFGNVAPLFNVALIPLQLMTAGNIIPAAMLSPLYRNVGHFLPAPNAIQGYLRLIYSGASVSSFVIHLLWIAIVTFGITWIRTALINPAPSPINHPANSH